MIPVEVKKTTKNTTSYVRFTVYTLRKCIDILDDSGFIIRTLKLAGLEVKWTRFVVPGTSTWSAKPVTITVLAENPRSKSHLRLIVYDKQHSTDPETLIDLYNEMKAADLIDNGETFLPSVDDRSVFDRAVMGTYVNIGEQRRDWEPYHVTQNGVYRNGILVNGRPVLPVYYGDNEAYQNYVQRVSAAMLPKNA